MRSGVTFEAKVTSEVGSGLMELDEKVMEARVRFEFQ